MFPNWGAPGPSGPEMLSTSGAFGNQTQILQKADFLLKVAHLAPAASKGVWVRSRTKAEWEGQGTNPRRTPVPKAPQKNKEDYRGKKIITFPSDAWKKL